MAHREKYGADLSVDDILQLRRGIQEKTAHIPQSDRFQVGKLIEYVENLGDPGVDISLDKVLHLRKLYLVRPDADASGDRTVYWYNRVDLQNVVLMLYLKQKHGVPLAKVGGLLWAEACQQNGSSTSQKGRPNVVMPDNQVRRAQYHLRGRMLETVLTWLFDGQTPYRAVALLRQQLAAAQETKINSRIIADKAEYTQVDRALAVQRGDLVVSLSSEGEILHPRQGIDWREYRHYQWYHLVLRGDFPVANYTIVLGVPPASELSLSPWVATTEAAGMLIPLLRLCFLPQWQDGSDQDAETPLQAVANMIPDISHYWQYCAILIPDKTSRSLRVLAHSASLPLDLHADTILLSPGQLLSGWTYQTGQVCVVQKSIGNSDPRLARQDEEQARGGVAVPTLVNGDINGIIYVGTRVFPSEGETFPTTQIRVLRLLGSIVGEFIERQAITQKTRRTGLRVLVEKPIQKMGWAGLDLHLQEVLEKIKLDPGPLDDLDNLHVMAVRLNNYHEIEVHSKEVAGWVAELIASTAGDFYLNLGDNDACPKVFRRCSSEFVVVVDHLRLDDAREKKLRNDLRRHLGTLMLPFRQGTQTVSVETLVWSLSFRYSALADKLEQKDITGLTRTLRREISDALANLPLIDAAHQKEAQGAYQLAYDDFRVAHERSPNNTYLMRHLAKMSTRLGNYQEAVEWWRRVLELEQHPRFYQHLAEVYALQRDYPAAVEHYGLGEQLDDQDPRCYLGWGQVLLARGQYREALRKFMKARSLDRDENQALYALREAEAYIGLGKFNRAKATCERALIWDRNNIDAVNMLLQILPKCV
jgi:tetratricopeptide (TPR) repeat protein